MKYLKIWLLISFLLFSASASAEFYKYVDEDGNTRFTDDINLVPEEQRSNIRSYVESVSEEASEQEAPEDQSNFPDLSDSTDGQDEENLEDIRKRIDEMKAEIDKEYETLKEEKKRLDKEKDQATTREQIENYNKMVENYNKRTEAFMQKQEERDALIDSYNTRISEKRSKNTAQ